MYISRCSPGRRGGNRYREMCWGFRVKSHSSYLLQCPRVLHVGYGDTSSTLRISSHYFPKTGAPPMPLLCGPRADNSPRLPGFVLSSPLFPLQMPPVKLPTIHLPPASDGDLFVRSQPRCAGDWGTPPAESEASARERVVERGTLTLATGVL